VIEKTFQILLNLENFAVCSFACLFAKLPQPGDNEVTFAVFKAKVKIISLSALPKDTTSELANLSSQYPL